MSAVSEEIGEGIMESRRKMVSGISEETSLKLRMLVAGGVSGAASKTCTAPLARLTILYQVPICTEESTIKKGTCLKLFNVILLLRASE